MTTTDYEPNIVLETGSYNVVGTRPVRHDAINKVTGRDQLARTFSLPVSSTAGYCAVPLPTPVSNR